MQTRKVTIEFNPQSLNAFVEPSVLNPEREGRLAKIETMLLCAILGNIPEPGLNKLAGAGIGVTVSDTETNSTGFRLRS